MSSTETPDFVEVVDDQPPYREFTQGDETFEVRVYDDGRLGCPKCGRYFTEHGLRQHLSCKHGISARETVECKADDCDTTWTQYPSIGKEYCSKDCVQADKDHSVTKEELVCPTCGDEFAAQPARDQTYCSLDCFHEQRTTYGPNA